MEPQVWGLVAVLLSIVLCWGGLVTVLVLVERSVKREGAQERAGIAEQAAVKYGWHDADECFKGCGH